MMAANYRHIGDRENRLGRHYSRFSPFWPTPALSGQSLDLRKLCDAGSNRRSQVSKLGFPHPNLRVGKIGSLVSRQRRRAEVLGALYSAPGEAAQCRPYTSTFWD